ncbi:uncharacterized protein LOC120160644 [Hibiscus syriacus]|uniref:uncharacterized protein LOC120160644 n=1 Tax=Hibiscus syriacus TaxID=106335 RepID=UPI001922117C|nr:uncharacterized protein LOC120160644 [Hibiscus syriacus]
MGRMELKAEQDPTSIPAATLVSPRLPLLYFFIQLLITILSFIGKVGGPDLKSFIRQFPSTSEGDKFEQSSNERTKETPEGKEKPFPENMATTIVTIINAF